MLLVLLVVMTHYLLLQKNFNAAPISSNQRIIEDVTVIDDIHRSEVTIKFSLPLRYQNHFPVLKGKQIRVNFRPLAVSEVDLDALFKRESIVPPKTELVPLEEIIFEGEFSGSRLSAGGRFSGSKTKHRAAPLRAENDFYLILSFKREVAFGIQQGRDFRSIVIYVCEKEFSIEQKQCLDY